MKPTDSSAQAAQSGRDLLAPWPIITLPAVEDITGYSIHRVINNRRSIRTFLPRDLTWREVGRLLWATQGISDPEAGLRTVPSAGALYPLELDVVIASGVFRYRPEGHSLAQRSRDDLREAVSQAAYRQAWLADAPCVLSFAAVMQRTARKYAARASRFIHLEAGHAAQNALLVATAIGLAGTPVGSFDDVRLARTLGLERAAKPIYLVAVGCPTD
jgi:SagB-type dehydrogenase family enzyme